MSQWYLNKNGQALGPLSHEKVVSLIESGDIKPIDLVYKAGTTDWLPASKFEEFAEVFSADFEKEARPMEDQEEKEWVLLKKSISEKGKEYKQMGPFSHAQVMELIDTGKIKFTDFAWRKGLDSWVKLANLEEFDEPLPSSPNIDLSLYEKTEAMVDESSLGVPAKPATTNEAFIETFEHETQSKVAESAGQEPMAILTQENAIYAATEEELDMVKESPINSESFVTTTGDDPDQTSESSLNLWSLKAPGEESKVLSKFDDENLINLDETTESRVLKVKEKIKKQSKSEARSGLETLLGGMKNISPEHLQWALAAGAVILSAFFFYQSLQSKKPNAVSQQAVQESVQVSVPPAVDAGLNAKGEPVRRNVAATTAGEVEAIREQAKQMKASKKMVKPARAKARKKSASVKASAAKKPKVVKPKKTVASLSVGTTKASSSNVKKAKGSKKARSFFRHRDRKAIFYSSLKAETLVVDIQKNFRKLKSDKRAWERYYRQWKKKLRYSLSKDIRNFPNYRETYAYPKYIEEFKKDHKLFKAYGEALNSRVLGRRVPSSGNQDFLNVFSKHKKRAQSLAQ